MSSRFKSNTVFSITSWAPLYFLKLIISPSNILNIYTMDRGAWWATDHSTAESDMTEQLRTHTMVSYSKLGIYMHGSNINI